MNRSFVMKLAGLMLLTLGLASIGSAVVPVAPEIDPAMGVNAVALLGGAMLVIRSKKR
jgi:hypothetical protein